MPRWTRLFGGLLIALLATVSASFADAASDPAGTWTAVAPLPTARSGLASVTGSDGRVYAIGGTNGVSLATVEAYDIATNTWAAVAPLPQPRSGLAAAVGPDGRIYAIGGASCTRSACTYPTAVDAYDPSTNTWAAVALLPTPRSGLAVATGPDGRIYAIGGSSNRGGPFATVEAYDPRTNTWSTAAPLPTGRSALAAAVGPDGRIYAIGGATPTSLSAGSTDSPTVDAYTTATNQWSAVASMPIGRAALAAVTGPDGRIYAIGGSFEHEGPQPIDAVEAYTPTTNRWAPVAPLPVPLTLVAGAAGPDGRLYAIGATETTVNVTYTNEAYTPACRFVLGFRTLYERIPDTVGSCLDDEQHNPSNGDGLQRTTGGLLVWRKADNFTAFTDGYRTWVNGPYGVRERLNSQRFPWEANPSRLPVIA